MVLYWLAWPYGHNSMPFSNSATSTMHQWALWANAFSENNTLEGYVDMGAWVYGCGHGCKSESPTPLLLFYIYVVAQLSSVIQQSPWSPSMCTSQMVWPNLNYWVECLNWWITPPPLDPNHRAYARKWKIVYLLWPTSSTGSPSQQNNHDVLKRWNFFLSNKM